MTKQIKMRNFVTKTVKMLAIGFCISAVAQDAPAKKTTNYSYVEAFAPNFYTKNGTETRSASGQPGAKYWQNRADYQINMSLNDKTNEFTGSETITYTNNSPDKLSFLWLMVDQNLFKKDSRGEAVIPVSGSRNGSNGQNFEGGHKIKSVKVIININGKEVEKEAKFEITDTRMKVISNLKLQTPE